MSALPQVVATGLIIEPPDCERRVLDGNAQVRALNARSQAGLARQANRAVKREPWEF